MDIMKTSGIKKKVIEEIRQLAVDYNIQKVILFGSRARGDYHERSDMTDIRKRSMYSTVPPPFSWKESTAISLYILFLDMYI